MSDQEAVSGSGESVQSTDTASNTTPVLSSVVSESTAPIEGIPGSASAAATSTNAGASATQSGQGNQAGNNAGRRDQGGQARPFQSRGAGRGPGGGRGNGQRGPRREGDGQQARGPGGNRDRSGPNNRAGGGSADGRGARGRSGGGPGGDRRDGAEGRGDRPQGNGPQRNGGPRGGGKGGGRGGDRHQRGGRGGPERIDDPAQARTALESMPPGSLVMYEDDGAPLLGTIVTFRFGRFLVLNDQGDELELQPFRLRRLPGALPVGLSSRIDRSSYLETLRNDAANASKGLDPAKIWEKVKETPRPYRSEELTELALGTRGLAEHIAIRLMLLDDRLYFKRDQHPEHGETFLPRTAAAIADIRTKEASRTDRQTAKEELIAWAKERLANPQHPVVPSVVASLELLEEVAAGAEGLQNHRRRDCKELVNILDQALKLKLSGPQEQRVSNLLERFGILTKRTNLAFQRHRPPMRFDDAHLAAAQALAASTPMAKKRRDYTSLEAVTIDDQSTKDMDDAFTIEPSTAGQILGIHISDVAALIPLQNLIDSAARNRATSLYAPERIVNMLPDSLANDACSLVTGQPRPALSAFVEYDHSGKHLRNWVERTTIRVSKRYTYDSADAALAAHDRLLQKLYELALNFETSRIEAGAIKVPRREGVVVVTDDGDIDITIMDEAAPSRVLVSELMVLANKVFAEYAAINHIPVVYRGQDGADKGDAGEDGGDSSNAGGRLKRSFLSIDPVPHASLALTAYLQSSSPIRRYVDLVNQRQIVAHLEGSPLPYDRKAIEQVLKDTADPLSRAQAITKETKRFYGLLMLEKLAAKGEPLAATVLRTDLKLPLIEVTAIASTFLTRSTRPIAVGDTVSVRVLHVNPQGGFARLEII